MKRSILTAISLAVILWFGTTPALTQHGRGAGPTSHGSNSSANNHGSSASPKSATDLLNRNNKLDSKLTANLQAKGLLSNGTDLKDACSGFRNLGQCIAAIHVSHNRNIPFACLKSDMTGRAPAAGSTCPAGTGTSKMSLGKAIQTLDPNADPKAEAKKATKQADHDIRESESESSS